MGIRIFLFVKSLMPGRLLVTDVVQRLDDGVG